MAGNTINVQGSYIDVHDNENVYLSVGKAQVSVDGASTTGEVRTREACISDEKLARAIEETQGYFWGNSAYAVVFCVCRDDYAMEANMSAFERKVEALEYSRKRKRKCPAGTLTNAFSNNKIYGFPVDKWEGMNARKRVVILRDELRKRLKT